MQELNFREMPEFTRRCLDEFGADCVRIRPVMPGGVLSNEMQWFMDVRNPEHPYFGLYEKIMETPIFEDPRVLLWSNNLRSTKTGYPSYKEIMHLRNVVDNQESVLNTIKSLLSNEKIPFILNDYLDGRKLAVFGLGAIGKALICVLEKMIHISVIFDRKQDYSRFHGILVENVDAAELFKGVVIISPYEKYNEMESELLQTGFNGEILGIRALIDMLEKTNM